MNTDAQILSEILQMMRQNDVTKEVFRELDGFLMLVNVLATLSAPEESMVVEPEEQVTDETNEALRRVFTVLSEAQANYPDNVRFFEVRPPFRRTRAHHSLSSRKASHTAL